MIFFVIIDEVIDYHPYQIVLLLYKNMIEATNFDKSRFLSVYDKTLSIYDRDYTEI